MTDKKHKKKSKRPATLPITHDREVPVHDVFEYLDLNKSWDVFEALQNLIYDFESNYFLTWEAVICEEEGFSLTKKQKKTLEKLISFNDDWDERILYVDEIPRPSEPWYESVRKVSSHLVEKEPFDTTEGGNEAIFEGWPKLLNAMEKYAVHLSLPEGVESPLDVFDPEIFHQLNLQLCLDRLSGLGQDDELTLENEEQQYRVELFTECLSKHKGMVKNFNLSLETLLTKVNMPRKDEKILVGMMMKQLDLPSEKSCLLDFL